MSFGIFPKAISISANLCMKKTLLFDCWFVYLPNREPYRSRKSAIEIPCHQAQDGEEKKASVKASQQRAIANGFHTSFCHIGSMHSTHTHTPLCLQQKFIVISSLNRLNVICQSTYIHRHTQLNR